MTYSKRKLNESTMQFLYKIILNYDNLRKEVF